MFKILFLTFPPALNQMTYNFIDWKCIRIRVVVSGRTDGMLREET